MDWREFKGEANLKRCVLRFERNVERDNELGVFGGMEFQSCGAMTEKEGQFYPEMFGYMGWTDLMNQMLLETESEMETKD